MGSIPQTCIITGRQINEDEEVAYFALHRKSSTSPIKSQALGMFKSTLPTFGLYDDYGGLKKGYDNKNGLSDVFIPCAEDQDQALQEARNQNVQIGQSSAISKLSSAFSGPVVNSCLMLKSAYDVLKTNESQDVTLIQSMTDKIIDSFPELEERMERYLSIKDRLGLESRIAFGTRLDQDVMVLNEKYNSLCRVFFTDLSFRDCSSAEFQFAEDIAKEAFIEFSGQGLRLLRAVKQKDSEAIKEFIASHEEFRRVCNAMDSIGKVMVPNSTMNEGDDNTLLLKRLGMGAVIQSPNLVIDIGKELAERTSFMTSSIRAQDMPKLVETIVDILNECAEPCCATANLLDVDPTPFIEAISSLTSIGEANFSNEKDVSLSLYNIAYVIIPRLQDWSADGDLSISFSFPKPDTFNVQKDMGRKMDYDSSTIHGPIKY